VHVPFKGASQAIPAVMGGEIESYVGNLVGSAIASIRSGVLRALGRYVGPRGNKQVPRDSRPSPKAACRASTSPSCVRHLHLGSAAGLPVHAKFTADLMQLLEKPALKSKLEEQGIDVAPERPSSSSRREEGNGTGGSGW
jgi:tripartite-type tricarboxylate transporter receptor subunit TctC